MKRRLLDLFCGARPAIPPAYTEWIGAQLLEAVSSMPSTDNPGSLENL